VIGGTHERVPGEDQAPLSLILGELTRKANVEERPVDEVVRGILETAADTLEVARVNAWLYDEQRRAIHCLDAFDARTRRHYLEDSLNAGEYPHYFAALEGMRNVTAIDARTDERTRELARDYLVVHEVTAMLDVPILRSGKVVGVVCHEHVGTPRAFDARERAFAGSIGDLVALVLETEQRVRSEAERNKLAQNLARLRGIESMGMLAAGIAHDFRNLLMVMAAGSEQLAKQLPPGPLQEAAGNVELAASRASELCERLLTYSGRRSSAPRTVDLGATALEVTRLLGPRAPRGVTTVTEIDPEVTIEGDPLELEQLVLNLVTNAFDASAGSGGHVAVRVSLAPRAPSPQALDFRRNAAPLALVEVADEGVGMSPEAQAQMFDPFFTTKPDGHGFGLATVIGIVRGHGGAIDVASTLGLGTTLSVFLPAWLGE